jgi:hypothetical protein
VELVMISPQTIRNEHGQTSLEYLLLLMFTFISAYIMITGPLAKATQVILAGIHDALGNVIQNGEMRPGSVAQPGEAGHPGDPKRLRAVHLGG